MKKKSMFQKKKEKKRGQHRVLSTRTCACTLAFLFYRFVMVVRKNVLEYIIALIVVKNKVGLKSA
jgi:hypothetical protein